MTECEHRHVHLVEVEQHPHPAVETGPLTTYQCPDCGALNLTGADEYLGNDVIIDRLKERQEDSH